MVTDTLTPLEPWQEAEAMDNVRRRLEEAVRRRQQDRRQGRSQRLAKVTSTFRRSTTAIVGRSVGWEFSHDTMAPAWTDGDTIYLCRDWSGGPDGLSLASRIESSSLARRLEAVTTVRSLTWHELGHILYSPRVSHQPLKAIIEQHGGVGQRVWNLVEDARIERLVAGRWRSASPYFVRLVSQFLLDGNDVEVALAWPLIAGRTYLPAETRRRVRAAFYLLGEADDGIGAIPWLWEPEVMPQVEQLIAEYGRTIIPTDAARQAEIVSEMIRLLARIPEPEDISIDGLGSASDDHEGTKGQREPAQAQRKAQKAAEDAEEPLEPEDDWDYGDDVAEGENGNSLAREGVEDGDEDGEDGTSSLTGAEDGDFLPGDAESDAPGDGASLGDDDHEGGHEGGKTSLGDTVEALKDHVAEQAEDARVEVEREAMDTLIEIGDIDYQPSKGSAKYTYEVRPPSSTARAAANRLVRHFDELRDALEPGWVRHRSSGKLNVPQVILSEAQTPDPNVFDTWAHTDEHLAGAEVAILLDFSGSMGAWVREGDHYGAEVVRDTDGNPVSRISQASEVGWILHRALTEAGIGVWVFGHDHDFSLLADPYHPSGTKVRYYNSAGGTDGAPPLIEIERRMASTDKHNRMVFVVSDGEYGDTKPVAQTLSRMERSGVEVTVLRVDSRGRDSHLARILAALKSEIRVQDIQSIYKLVELVEAAVTRTVRRALETSGRARTRV